MEGKQLMLQPYKLRRSAFGVFFVIMHFAYVLSILKWFKDLSEDSEHTDTLAWVVSCIYLFRLTINIFQCYMFPNLRNFTREHILTTSFLCRRIQKDCAKLERIHREAKMSSQSARNKYKKEEARKTE